MYQRKSEEVRNLTAPEGTWPAAGPSNTSREGGQSHAQNHSQTQSFNQTGSSPGSRSGGHGTPLTPHVSSSTSHDVLVSGASEHIHHVYVACLPKC